MSKLSQKKPVIEFQVELEENKGSNVSTAIDPNTDVSYTINCSFVIKVTVLQVPGVDACALDPELPPGPGLPLPPGLGPGLPPLLLPIKNRPGRHSYETQCVKLFPPGALPKLQSFRAGRHSDGTKILLVGGR